MRLCVFCGSKPGFRPEYREAAETVGRELARRQVGLVYGGAHHGLMGFMADATLREGGEVVGVMPRSLVDVESAHRGLSELHIVESMHERKALMAAFADGFIALPGGLGTWDELCEALSWAQLRIHSKPCGLLNLHGYYDPLLALMDRAVVDGLLKPEHRDLLMPADEPGPLLDQILSLCLSLP